MKNMIAYKVVMSRGDDLPVDADEMAKVVAAIQAGTPVKVRSGIFNPSFYVSIVEDKERVGRFFEETKYDPARRGAGMKSLKDIFADAPLKLAEGKKTALLGRG